MHFFLILFNVQLANTISQVSMLQKSLSPLLKISVVKQISGIVKIIAKLPDDRRNRAKFAVSFFIARS